MSLAEKDSTQKKSIPIGKPVVDQQEKAAMAEALDSPWILNGPKVRAFEELFAKKVGASHACGVASATAGMQVALKALGVAPGDEVILPAFNFIAAGIAVLSNGALPIFVDVCPDTFQLDLQQVPRKITPRTKAILALHYAGGLCEIEPLVQMAHGHGVKVVEDAAHAAGASYNGSFIGVHSDATVFSFGPMKVMTTAMGGMVTCGDKQVDRRMRSLISYGMDKSLWDRRESPKPWEYQIRELGGNFRMTDVQAAMGIVQLAKLDRFVQQRRAIAHWYQTRLKEIPGIVLQSHPSQTAPVHLYYVLRVVEKDFGLSRDALALALLAKGVQVSVHWDPPLCCQPLLVDSLKGATGPWPITEQLAKEVLTLPCYPGLSEGQVEDIVSDIWQIRAGAVA